MKIRRNTIIGNIIIIDPALLTYDLIDERVLSNTYTEFWETMYHSIKMISPTSMNW